MTLQPAFTKLQSFWPMLLSGLITSGRLGIQSVALRQTIRAIDQTEPLLGEQLEGWIPSPETLPSLTRLRELGNSADASIAEKLLPDRIPPWPALRAIARAFYTSEKQQPTTRTRVSDLESSAIAAVVNHPGEILARLFHPSPLVQAGWRIDGQPDLRDAFEAADKQYKNRQYSSAKQAFFDISEIAELRYPGSGRSALINAAACAVANKEFDDAIDLLQPAYSNGILYGIPLWNIALAFYRVDNASEALAAVDGWLKRNRIASLTCRGLLVAAGLAALADDRDRSAGYVQQAVGLDPVNVSWSLRIIQEVEEDFVERTLPPPSPEQRATLMALVQPRRPATIPESWGILSRDESKNFNLALEALGEGDYQRAFDDIRGLAQTHPGVPLLQAAVGSSLLFLDRNAEALDKLYRASSELGTPNGSVLWNLASAQLRTGDFSGALASLKGCAQTEYRSSAKLWKAIDLLDSSVNPLDEPVATAESSAHASGTEHSALESLTTDLTGSVTEIRETLLRRLLRPQRLQWSWQPDRYRLRQSEAEQIRSLLKRAREAEPRQRAKVLASVLGDYPTSYTLRAHAAAYAVADPSPDNLKRAIQWLNEAQEISSSLDRVSRMNLIFAAQQLDDRTLCAKATAVAGAAADSLRARWEFWLALAVMRAAHQVGDPGEAARRALEAAPANPRTVDQIDSAITLAEIPVAPPAEEQDPILRAISEAQRHLDTGEISATFDTLSALWASGPGSVPEIGSNVFEPVFLSDPHQHWSESQRVSFSRAVTCYRGGNYARAGDIFSKGYADAGSIRWGLNAMAALVQDDCAPIRVAAVAKTRSLKRLKRDSRAAHNLLVAWRGLDDAPGAINALRSRLGMKWRYIMARSERLARTTAALCLFAKERSSRTNEVLLLALEALRRNSNPPSQMLLLAIAAAKLVQESPDVKGARETLEQVRQLPGQPSLKPPAEIVSSAELREALEQLQSSVTRAEVVSYVERVVQTARERIPPNIVTAVAGLTILAEFSSKNRCWRDLLQYINDSEKLLFEFRPELPPGLAALNWLNLAKVAREADLGWTALRFCAMGLDADPTHEELQRLASQLNTEVSEPERKAYSSLIESLGTLSRDLISGSRPIDQVIRDAREIVRKTLGHHGALQTLDDRLRDVVESAGTADDESGDMEEIVAEVTICARMLLPEDVASAIEEFMRTLPGETDAPDIGDRLTLEIQGETLWPRADEREGCCTLEISSDSNIDWGRLQDTETGAVLWDDGIKGGMTNWIRWRISEEDVLVRDEVAEISLSLSTEKSGMARIRTFSPIISAREASWPTSWPTYGTAALDPQVVEELYGRQATLERLIRNLGSRRAGNSYFLEGPRRMGKTSVLRFVQGKVPDQVLAVYVNLERGWGGRGVPTLWGYIADNVASAAAKRDEYGREYLKSIIEFSDFLSLAKRVCEDLDKEYVLLLLDEFHCILEKTETPGLLLSDLRAIHDSPDASVSLLIADRFTRGELMNQQKHEIWAQLKSLGIGPLDLEATRFSLTTTPIGEKPTDLFWPPRTIEVLHAETGGYPHHINYAAVAIVEELLTRGPWLVALPEDVEWVAKEMLSDDELFQVGLCRPDRITPVLERCIAALLKWDDLLLLLPTLGEEPEWKSVAETWHPRAEEFLAEIHSEATSAESLEKQLMDVGILKKTNSEYSFFSPLLKKWLRKMREEGRALGPRERSDSWGDIGKTAALDAADLANLDSQLLRVCEQRQKAPPLLQLKQHVFGDRSLWGRIGDDVSDKESLQSFLVAAATLFVDKRENKKAMQQYPRLCLAYHQLRLVRNYHVHPGAPSTASVAAWNALCKRAIKKHSVPLVPNLPDEFAAIRNEILGDIYAGYKNALALAENPL